MDIYMRSKDGKTGLRTLGEGGVAMAIWRRLGGGLGRRVFRAQENPLGEVHTQPPPPPPKTPEEQNR